MTLAGIDSVHRPRADRLQAWSRLATDLDPALLPLISREVGLSEVIDIARATDRRSGPRACSQCSMRLSAADSGLAASAALAVIIQRPAHSGVTNMRKA